MHAIRRERQLTRTCRAVRLPAGSWDDRIAAPSPPLTSMEMTDSPTVPARWSGVQAAGDRALCGAGTLVLPKEARQLPWEDRDLLKVPQGPRSQREREGVEPPAR